jgi:NADH-quinone oxidoreductase subunit C
MGKIPKAPTPPPHPAEPSGGKSWGEPIDSLLIAISDRFPNVVLSDARLFGEAVLIVSPNEVFDLAMFLRDNEKCPFNYCRCVTGTDKIDIFDVTYNLARLPKLGQKPDAGFATIALLVRITDRKDPHTPSLVKIWPGVDFQEREIFDLVGVHFDGHPDLRRILLDESFEGCPLRKDYPLVGRWEDAMALDAYLDEGQVRTMKESAGLKFDPGDVPPNYKR